MKLENEHVLSVQSPPRKSYNPFESDDEDSNDCGKDNIKGYDIKSFEATPDSLTFHLDDSNLSWEEAILGHSQILSNPIAADASNEEVLRRKDTELFTDKIVTECELPKLMFSYKDNVFHSVKDIGIDEGVPTLDKVWIKSHDNHETAKLPAVRGLNDGVNTDLTFMDGLKTQSDNEVKRDRSAKDSLTEDSVKETEFVREVLEKPHSAYPCGTDDLLKADELKHDSSKEGETNSSWQNTGDLVENGGVINGKVDHQASEKDEVNCCRAEKTGDEVSKEHCNGSVPLEYAEESSAMLSIMHDVVATMKSNEVHHAEIHPAEPSMIHEAEATMKSNEVHHAEIFPAKPSIMHEAQATVESTEVPNGKPTSVQSAELPASHDQPGSSAINSLPYNSKVESGSIILDFNGDTTSVDKEKEEISQMNESAIEKPPGTQSMCRDEGGPLPVYNSILDCNTDKRVHGETSFSAAMPPPSSITYMGPVAYSGNVSLRSESSAGSTRSFAFPVLQAEWNSSPVRMAKADEGHFRKQRGWVHSLVCCKF